MHFVHARSKAVPSGTALLRSLLLPALSRGLACPVAPSSVSPASACSLKHAGGEPAGGVGLGAPL
eukprot:12144531-Heterocapsa_arctica.AAC.1